MDLDSSLCFERDVLELHTGFPLFKALCDELLFNPAVNEKFIDATELIGQGVIVDIAHDGRQLGLQGLLNGNQ